MSKARRRGGKRKELSDTTEQRAQRIEVGFIRCSCPPSPQSKSLAAFQSAVCSLMKGHVELLQEKLAIAEAKRQSTLDAVRLKAAASLSRMQEVSPKDWHQAATKSSS